VTRPPQPYPLGRWIDADLIDRIEAREAEAAAAALDAQEAHAALWGKRIADGATVALVATAGLLIAAVIVRLAIQALT